jgi:hypothetical protein
MSSGGKSDSLDQFFRSPRQKTGTPVTVLPHKLALPAKR